MEILLIFLVILLVFGAKRIPEIARGMGKGIREFKDATNDIKKELTVEDNANRIHAPRPPAQQTAPRTDAYQNQPSQAPAQPSQPAEQSREQQAS